MYAIPSMPNTAKRYNPDDPSRCVELRRFCCVDDTPTNTESYFIGQTIKWIRQNTDVQVIISYSDLFFFFSLLYSLTSTVIVFLK